MRGAGRADARAQALALILAVVVVLLFALMHASADLSSSDARLAAGSDVAVNVVDVAPPKEQTAVAAQKIIARDGGDALEEHHWHGRPPSPLVPWPTPEDVDESPQPVKTTTELALPDPFQWSAEQLQRNFSYTEHLQLTKLVCGPLCSLPEKLKNIPYKNLSRTITPEEMQAHYVSSPVDCSRLFTPLAERLFDAPSRIWLPPSEIPPELFNEFTLDGRMSNSSKYYYSRYSGSQAMVSEWSKTLIDGWIFKARNKSLSGNYGRILTGALFSAILKADVREKRVLVIGSETPWVEALCLAAGAAHVTTLEYGKINSKHPNVSTLLPGEMTRGFSQRIKDSDLFDAVVSFSSIEHSGLGRYGDILNPWGDVIAIARAWCVMKRNAPLIIGVPGCRFGFDHLDWNGHRNYGRLRLAVLLQNFWFEEFVSDFQEDNNNCVSGVNKRGGNQIIVVARARK